MPSSLNRRARRMPLAVRACMLWIREGYTLIPLFFKTLSQYLVIPYIFLPGSSSVTVIRPIGSDRGESMDTRLGPVSIVARIISSSAPILWVTAKDPSSKHHPEGRDSEPVKSIPTTFIGLMPRSRSLKVIAGPVLPSYGLNCTLPSELPITSASHFGG